MAEIPRRRTKNKGMCAQLYLFATSQTVARQAPLFLGFPRQEYWSWVATSLSRGSPEPRDQTWISCTSCLT